MLHMNKNTTLLQNIWLSEKESHIYLSLLEYWKSSIVDISNNTGLHRMQIYRILPLMLESGYIFESQIWKRKYYIPASPERIEAEYERIVERNKNDLQELKDKFHSHDNDTNIIFKKWRAGIKNVYNDIVDTTQRWWIFYRITSEVDIEKIKNYYQPYNYLERRDQKEIERYIIMSEKTSLLKEAKLEREIKVINKNIDIFDDNISFTIYENKISLIDFNTETSIIIESREISEYLEKIFKLLFKKL